MKKLSIFLFAGIALLAACNKSTVPVAVITTITPTEADVERANTKWPGTSLEQLNKGHQIYISRCGECHRHFKPTAFPETKWRHEVPPMAKKAKLTGGEEDLVLRYVVTMSEAAPKK